MESLSCFFCLVFSFRLDFDSEEWFVSGKSCYICVLFLKMIYNYMCIYIYINTVYIYI